MNSTFKLELAHKLGEGNGGLTGSSVRFKGSGTEMGILKVFDALLDQLPEEVGPGAPGAPGQPIQPGMGAAQGRKMPAARGRRSSCF